MTYESPREATAPTGSFSWKLFHPLFSCFFGPIFDYKPDTVELLVRDLLFDLTQNIKKVFRFQRYFELFEGYILYYV